MEVEVPGEPNYKINIHGVIHKKSSETPIALHKCNKGYWRGNVGSLGCIRIHLLLARAFIPNPDNLPIVDHINQDVTDNRLENLRWVTHEESMRNRRAVFKNSTTKEKNISYTKNARGTMVYDVSFQRKIDGKKETTYRSACSTLEEAIRRRDEFLRSGTKIQSAKISECKEPYITTRARNYRLCIKQLDIYATFDTLEEAIEARDKIINGE